MKFIKKHLLKGELRPLESLLSTVGLEKFFSEEFSLEGHDPILKSPHRLGEAVSYVLALDAIIH